MPEGPEIRLAADLIESALKGRKTTEVFFAFSELKRHEKKLAGRKVLKVETRGKAMLTCFEGDLVIYSHNQLYGKWMTRKAGETPDSTRQLRLAIHNRLQSAFLYSASEIEVLAKKDLAKHPFLARLGPDLLSQTPTQSELVHRLQSKAFRNRQFAGLLLDQGFVAGLGNYLRAEILAFSQMHPKRKPADCEPAELRAVAKQILELTGRSYRTGGVINPPRRVKQLKAEGFDTREQYRFSVYRRDGKPCYTCGVTILRIDAGGRHIYFCPNCQPVD